MSWKTLTGFLFYIQWTVKFWPSDQSESRIFDIWIDFFVMVGNMYGLVLRIHLHIFKCQIIVDIVKNANAQIYGKLFDLKLL